MEAQTPADQLGSVIHCPELPGDSDKQTKAGPQHLPANGAFSATSSCSKGPGSGQLPLPNLLAYLTPEVIHYLYQSIGEKLPDPVAGGAQKWVLGNFQQAHSTPWCSFSQP